jgi:hypothetical protein
MASTPFVDPSVELIEQPQPSRSAATVSTTFRPSAYTAFDTATAALRSHRREIRWRRCCRRCCALLCFALMGAVSFSLVVVTAPFDVSSSLLGVAPQFRVAKALGSKPYGTLRVSLITDHADQAPTGWFDYSARFEHKWTQFALHSSLVSVVPGVATSLVFGGEALDVWLPPQGSGVAGVLIADPCVAFDATLFERAVEPCYFTGQGCCTHAAAWHTTERTPALLNALLAHNDTDFWGILGDNFYDSRGRITEQVYKRLKPSTLAKISVMVPGNHGTPASLSPRQRCMCACRGDEIVLFLWTWG